MLSGVLFKRNVSENLESASSFFYHMLTYGGGRPPEGNDNKPGSILPWAFNNFVYEVNRVFGELCSEKTEDVKIWVMI